MKKIFVLVLLVFLFGCDHPAPSKAKVAGWPGASQSPVEVKLGGYVFTKPAGWSISKEYECSRYWVYWDKPADLNSERKPLPCFVREMYSSSKNFRITVVVRGLPNRKRTNVQLCEFDADELDNCFRDSERMLLYRKQANLSFVYMVFFSDPLTEIVFEVESSSEMTPKEAETFAVLLKSIHLIPDRLKLKTTTVQAEEKNHE